MSKIVYFESPIDDASRASAFYRDAFGWEVASPFGDMQYWLVNAGPENEPGANGALIGRGDIHRTPVLIIGVDDLDGALARVRATSSALGPRWCRRRARPRGNDPAPRRSWGTAPRTTAASRPART